MLYTIPADLAESECLLDVTLTTSNCVVKLTHEGTVLDCFLFALTRDHKTRQLRVTVPGAFSQTPEGAAQQSALYWFKRPVYRRSNQHE